MGFRFRVTANGKGTHCASKAKAQICVTMFRIVGQITVPPTALLLSVNWAFPSHRVLHDYTGLFLVAFFN